MTDLVTKEINGESYVRADDYDTVMNLYVDTLKEATELKKENDEIKKENTRLKRIERRQQRRFMADAERPVELKGNHRGVSTGDIVSLPNPKLNELTDEQLEKRTDILEATFVDLYNEDE